MWTIAGLVIGVIVLSSAYIMLSKYTHNAEVNGAIESFELLTSSADSICKARLGAQETKVYSFPSVVKGMHISSVSQGESSNTICMEIRDEGEICDDINLCNVTMPLMDLTRTDSLFYMIQKAIGKGARASVEFTIKKTDINNLNITWQHVYTD